MGLRFPAISPCPPAPEAFRLLHDRLAEAVGVILEYNVEAPK